VFFLCYGNAEKWLEIVIETTGKEGVAAKRAKYNKKKIDLCLKI
jgi:hypothetical protein